MLYNKIIDKTEKSISNYGLFSQKEVYVAFSGGKDSMLLCMVLKELGYTVNAITIDVGYNIEWKALKYNLEWMGVNHIFLDMNYPNISNAHKVQIVNNYKDIIRTSSNIHGYETPCTLCYNSKILLLSSWAKFNNIDTIVFAHHATDAIASFLKSYYYYKDCVTNNNSKFEYLRYLKLVKDNSALLLDDTNVDLWNTFISDLKVLSQKNVIGTDEPPKKTILNSNIQIVRPFFEVYDTEIKDYFSDKKYIFQESECIVSKLRTKKSLSPREMIHNYFLNLTTTECQHEMMAIVKDTITLDGFFRYNVRNNRDLILGRYKDTLKTRIKL
ncbi:MAG: 7-cyano-7-deazaguanine synthase [Ruminococcus sp.]|nr:7-cyano-7-deazaguanine synthase [Ruminococcus sp.]